MEFYQNANIGSSSVLEILPLHVEAYPVTKDSLRRSVFFNYSPALERDNLPGQRMSIYPDHVLERLRDQGDILTLAGYV